MDIVYRQQSLRGLRRAENSIGEPRAECPGAGGKTI